MEHSQEISELLRCMTACSKQLSALGRQLLESQPEPAAAEPSGPAAEPAVHTPEKTIPAAEPAVHTPEKTVPAADPAAPEKAVPAADTAAPAPDTEAASAAADTAHPAVPGTEASAGPISAAPAPGPEAAPAAGTAQPAAPRSPEQTAATAAAGRTVSDAPLQEPNSGFLPGMEEVCRLLVGDHCRFCRRKATCGKRAEYNLALSCYHGAAPDTLTFDELDAILGRLEQLSAWSSDVRDYALQQALQGAEFTDFKLVESRTKRRYTDEALVAQIVAAAGYDPYEKTLLGVTAMTNLLGRKQFEALLGDLTEKPMGKPMLAPKSDGRPAMQPADFIS